MEHVVQHERKPLCRREGIEHDKEGEADRVGQQRFLLGLRRSLSTDQRIGDVAVERLHASRVACPRHVQTDAGNDRGRFAPGRTRGNGMNAQSDFDQLLDSWLADGPSELPDQAVSRIVQSIDNERRPSWLPRRETMNRLVVAAGSVAAADAHAAV